MTLQGRPSPLHVLQCPTNKQKTRPNIQLLAVEVAEVATVQHTVRNYGLEPDIPMETRGEAKQARGSARIFLRDASM